jgi:peptide/nickel transport system substrate-binding protein
MNRFARLGAAALAATVLITGCTAGGGGDDEESTLYILTSDTEVGFDPANSVDFPTTWLGLVGRRLTTWSTESGTVEVVPDLATDLGTPSEDGTVWTYTLKDDIFFENGDPITSADIKWGVERTFAPELAGGLTYHVGLLEGGSEYAGPFDGATLDAIETPDDKTIVFHLTTAYGDWPWLVAMNAFIPVPEGEGTDIETFGEQIVASGPYKVESNEDGNETVLVRNEFWDQATDEARTAEPDRIVFRQSQNPQTIAQSLISDTGDARTSVNAYPLGGAELALVHADPAAEERLVTSDGGFMYYTALNMDSPELSDPLVRQAVHYAVDRDAIVLALGGEEAAAPHTNVITPGIPGYEANDLYPRDVDKAIELLAEAGHADGVTLDLWVANEDTAAAEAMQQGLAEANITVNIVPMDIGVMYGDAMGGNPGYDLFLSYWIPDYPSANSNISLLFESMYIDGGYNLSRTNDASLDEAIVDAIATTDLDEATAKWTGIDEQIMELGSMLPLYVTRSSFLRGSGVGAFEVPAYPSVQNYLTISLGE